MIPVLNLNKHLALMTLFLLLTLSPVLSAEEKTETAPQKSSPPKVEEPASPSASSKPQETEKKEVSDELTKETTDKKTEPPEVKEPEKVLVDPGQLDADMQSLNELLKSANEELKSSTTEKVRENRHQKLREEEAVRLGQSADATYESDAEYWESNKLFELKDRSLREKWSTKSIAVGVSVVGSGFAASYFLKRMRARLSLQMDSLRSTHKPSFNRVFNGPRSALNTASTSIGETASNISNYRLRRAVEGSVNPEACRGVLNRVGAHSPRDFVRPSPWNPFRMSDRGRMQDNDTYQRHMEEDVARLENPEADLPRPVDYNGRPRQPIRPDENTEAMAETLKVDGEVHTAYKEWYEAYVQNSEILKEVVGKPVSKLPEAPKPEDLLIDVPWSKEKIVDINRISEFVGRVDEMVRANEAELEKMNRNLWERTKHVFRGGPILFKENFIRNNMIGRLYGELRGLFVRGETRDAVRQNMSERTRKFWESTKHVVFGGPVIGENLKNNVFSRFFGEMTHLFKTNLFAFLVGPLPIMAYFGVDIYQTSAFEAEVQEDLDKLSRLFRDMQADWDKLNVAGLPDDGLILLTGYVWGDFVEKDKDFPFTIEDFPYHNFDSKDRAAIRSDAIEAIKRSSESELEESSLKALFQILLNKAASKYTEGDEPAYSEEELDEWASQMSMWVKSKAKQMHDLRVEKLRLLDEETAKDATTEAEDASVSESEEAPAAASK